MTQSQCEVSARPVDPSRSNIVLFFAVGLLFLGTASTLVAAEGQRFEERRRKEEQKEAEMKWSNAESSYLVGDYDTARKLYLTIIRQFAETDYALKALGRIGDVYRSQKSYKQAVEFYRRMTSRYQDLEPEAQKRLREDYIRARYQIGATYYDQKEYRRVFGELRRFLQDFPDSKYANVAYFLIGESHVASDNFRAAIQAFDLVGTAQGSGAEGDLPAVSPGDMLYVQVEDPDMRTAGVGRLIKARLTTSAGDLERVYLQPRGIHSAMYVGKIKTKLGAPQKTAPLEDLWSVEVDRNVSRTLREVEELQRRATELRERRERLKKELDAVAADDSLSGEEQVKKVGSIKDEIANCDENIISSKRRATEKTESVYEQIDAAYKGIEDFLKEHAPDRTIEAIETKLEEEKDQEEKAKTSTASTALRKASDGGGSRGGNGGVFSRDEILEVRKVALESPTGSGNFQQRRSVLRYWVNRLLHDLKRLEVVGSDKLTVLYRDTHVSSGQGPVMRKSVIALASDAYVSFASEDYQTDVQQEVYSSPTNLKVVDADMDAGDERDSVEVVLSVVEPEQKEGEGSEETDEGQLHGGHPDYRDSYAPTEQYKIKKSTTESGEVKRKVVEAETDEKPPLIPEGAPHARVRLTETEPHSGVFTAELKGTPRGVMVGEQELVISPDQRLRAAYTDERNISRRKPWVVWSAVKLLPSSEGNVEAPQTQDSPLTRRAQLEKGISEGELAKVYEELGLQEMAELYYQKALRTCGKVAKQEGLTALGQEATHAIWRLYFESGQAEKAIAACEQLVKEFPDSELVDEAYLTMGKALMEKANATEGREKTRYARRAVSSLTRLLRAKPKSEYKAEALYRIGEALFMAGESGTKYMERIVKEHPDSPYAALALQKSGRHAYENKDYPSAYEYFTRIVMNYPDAENIDRVMYLRGHCQAKQRKYSRALRAYYELIDNHPGSPYAKKARKIADYIRKKMNRQG
jgi:outer membrane protein assembly factor BamD (BamD/ComL family)